MHEYSVVVHLDMDFLVLKPMDHLFDAFFQPDEETKNIPDAMWPEDRRWTGRIETMFTRDYPMCEPLVRVLIIPWAFLTVLFFFFGLGQGETLVGQLQERNAGWLLDFKAKPDSV